MDYDTRTFIDSVDGMLRRGWSLRQIGLNVGMSASGVLRRVNRAGYKIEQTTEKHLIPINAPKLTEVA